jgi:hypothetical protein
MYFWLRPRICASMGTFSCRNGQHTTSHRTYSLGVGVRQTYQLLRQRDLLELHLVDTCLGTDTQQRSCGKQSSLHDGQLAFDDASTVLVMVQKVALTLWK